MSDKRLIELNPLPISKILADGIFYGVVFNCPKYGKMRHQVHFYPPINPYPEFDAAEWVDLFYKEKRIKPHKKVSGDSWENLTIFQSIGNMSRDKKTECCHLHIINGIVTGDF